MEKSWFELLSEGFEYAEWDETAQDEYRAYCEWVYDYERERAICDGTGQEQ